MNNHLVCTLTASVLCFAVVGCEDKNPPSSSPPAQKSSAPDSATGRSKDDPQSKMPIDQSRSASDTAISADIRQAIMNEPGTSTNAQNCKIISSNGVVTLRGTVANQAEKDMIEAKAKAVAGVTRVDNQLEVTGN